MQADSLPAEPQGKPILANAIRQKEIKVIHTGEKEIKLSVFEDKMIIYAKNSKESTKNSWNQNTIIERLQNTKSKYKAQLFLYILVLMLI